MTATEYVVLVDENDNETGLEEKIAAHQQNLLHRAFSVFLFAKGSKSDILLQQRALSKYHSPGLWTNTCCSHPRSGEDIINAGKRRLQEELNIHAELKSLGWFHYNAHFDNGLSENEFDYVLIGEIDKEDVPAPNPDEVHALRWVNIEELKRELARQPALFTPWLDEALSLVVEHLQR